MYKKICPNCGEPSYSADDSSWKCPYCGEDISDIDKKVAGNEDNQKSKSRTSSNSSILKKYLEDSERDLNTNSSGGENNA